MEKVGDINEQMANSEDRWGLQEEAGFSFAIKGIIGLTEMGSPNNVCR